MFGYFKMFSFTSKDTTEKNVFSIVLTRLHFHQKYLYTYIKNSTRFKLPKKV